MRKKGQKSSQNQKLMRRMLICLVEETSTIIFEQQATNKGVEMLQQEQSKQIAIKNQSGSKVAFKIRTTNASAFKAIPHQGVLDPQATKTFSLKVFFDKVSPLDYPMASPSKHEKKDEKLQILAVELDKNEHYSSIDIPLDIWKSVEQTDIQSDIILTLKVRRKQTEDLIKSTFFNSKLSSYQSSARPTPTNNIFVFNPNETTPQMGQSIVNSPKEVRSRVMSTVISNTNNGTSNQQKIKFMDYYNNISNASIRSQSTSQLSRVTKISNLQSQAFQRSENYKKLYEELLLATDELEKQLFMMSERKNQLRRELSDIKYNQDAQFNPLNQNGKTKTIRWSHAFLVLVLSFMLGMIIKD